MTKHKDVFCFFTVVVAWCGLHYDATGALGFLTFVLVVVQLLAFLLVGLAFSFKAQDIVADLRRSKGYKRQFIAIVLLVFILCGAAIANELSGWEQDAYLWALLPLCFGFGRVVMGLSLKTK